MNDYRKSRKRRKRQATNQVHINQATNTVFARNVGAVQNITLSPSQEWDQADRSESKEATVSFKITPSQDAMVRRIAAELGLTPSDIYRDGLELFCAFYPEVQDILADADRILSIYRMMKR